MFPVVSRRVVGLYKGELADIGRLLFRKQFIKGRYTDIFEKDFARYTGAKYAIAVGSGRLALYAILQALDLPKGSQVIVSAYEDMSVPEAIRQAGLEPVFVDIDCKTQNIDLSQLKGKLTDKTSAVVAAHIFGNPLDVPGIRAIIGERKISVIEDCAHALGTRFAGEHVGTAGDVAFFSFNTTKPFMCFGGGMIITGDERIHDALRSYTNSLPYPGYFDIMNRIFSTYFLYFLTSELVFSLFVFPCLNFLVLINVEPRVIYKKLFKRSKKSIEAVKFANIQAFIGIRNFEGLENALMTRGRNARMLDALIRSDISRPLRAEGCNYYFFILFSKDRDAFRRRMLREGLDSGQSLMRDCEALFKANELFPNTGLSRAESVQIPVYEQLPQGKIEAIARIINRCFVC